jgi:hypothetical protein
MVRKSSPVANGAKPFPKTKTASKSKTAQRKTPALADIKREVLALAKVTNTKELKRTNADLRPLDFRLKVSWLSALTVLRQAAAAYPDWHSNPPEEYRELFQEIDAASASYARSIDKGMRLSEELEQAADDIDALADELQQEASELRSVQMAATGQAHARRFN